MTAVQAPSMPDISLPHVDLHEVGGKVQELASFAAERLDDLPDRAVALAGTVIPALRPSPKRSRRPLLLVVVAVAGVLGATWFLRSRRDQHAVDPLPAATPDAVPAAS